MVRCRLILPVLALALAGAALVLAASAPARRSGPSGMVRRDWYLRESLPAIRDWEAILARWENRTPAEARAMALPVPSDGTPCQWPNPYPATLLPGSDAERRVTLRQQASGAVTAQADGAAAEILEPGKPWTAYRYFGGGGKDQWYHHFERRIDQLTVITPLPAPFALDIPGAFDFLPGHNDLPITLRGAAPDHVEVALQLKLITASGETICGMQRVSVGPGERHAMPLGFDLAGAGGGLLLLTLDCAGKQYRVPILTYVEGTGEVLKGIEGILADTPDPGASQRLAGLAERLRKSPTGREWRALFEEASALRDELLLARIRFDKLLFVKRKPFISEQPYMDAHHLFNRPGGGIYSLSPVRPDGMVTPVVDDLGEGVYRDINLHWNDDRILFSFGNGNDAWDGGQSYHIYEAGLGGGKVRQVTTGPKNDCEPFYLPNGQVGFTSDRGEHFVMCGGDRHSANLWVKDPDASAPRQLSFNMFNDFNPAVMPDGRILYSRWEYNERSVTSLHKLFTMNPDGTQVAPFYGNTTIRPNVTMFPRPVPGSRKVTALFTAHHGQTHGPIGLIDPDQGADGANPVTILTPGVPVSGEGTQESRFGWYSDPQPISETTYLCSFTPSVQPWLEWSWALYVGDRHGNLALVYRDPEISCAEPTPVERREQPLLRGPAGPGSDSTTGEATVMMADVYRGLSGVKRGEAKWLRILEDIPRKGVHQGGVVVTCSTGIYTVKRVLGLVPIAADGSANFTVPSNRNVYFEVLDADKIEIQRMRSVVCLKPGEKRTCVGCHEPRRTSPPNQAFMATAHAPSRAVAPPWGDRIISYLRDVQPVINSKCVGCHAFDRAANRVILTDDLTDQYCVGYEELAPYTAPANSMRWDTPDDVYPRPARSFGSGASKLAQMLRSGHHEVQLSPDEMLRLTTWIDANGVYYDRYECAYPERRIFGQARGALDGVYRRRCGGCHGKAGDGGRMDTWWLSVNRRDPAQSRMLLAPLAASAGGWQRCDGAVFADRNDPDYRAILDALKGLADRLAQTPREDLATLKGDPAEHQPFILPRPPATRAVAEPPPTGDWTHLGDLKWEHAVAGWSPNNDGLPRIDSDIEEGRIRAGGRTYRRGIGTHAPSEIVYRLDGAYTRFHAVAAACERSGTVTFAVYADGKLLWESGKLAGGGVTAPVVDVPMAGVRELRLVVGDAGDGINCDEASWADARLLRAK